MSASGCCHPVQPDQEGEKKEEWKLFTTSEVWKVHSVHFNSTNVTCTCGKHQINCHYRPRDSISSSTLPVKQLASCLGVRCVVRRQADTVPTCQGICVASCGWLWHQHKVNWSKQMRRGISVCPDGLWIDKRAETIRNSNPLCLCRRQSQRLRWCQNVLKASLRALMPIKTKKKKRQIKSSNSNSLKSEGLPAGQTHGALPCSRTPQSSSQNVFT